MVIVRGPSKFDVGGRQNRVRISHSFAIAAKEVTVEQFQRFLEGNPRIRAKNTELYSPEPTCPMNSVSWYDAAAYCDWLSKQEGMPEHVWCYAPNIVGDYAGGMKLKSNPYNREGYRLPTEEEWEYSCRAGAATGYSFGEHWELLERYGWYIKNSPNRSQPVGRLKPNDLGLFDAHGNIWEWCHDFHRDNVIENLNDERIIHDSYGYYFTQRGGAFNDRPALVRSACRFRGDPSIRYNHVGFRPARTYP
jgi:formylglycine-generating enzyme required for sulfatase activity